MKPKRDIEALARLMKVIKDSKICKGHIPQIRKQLVKCVNNIDNCAPISDVNLPGHTLLNHLFWWGLADVDSRYRIPEIKPHFLKRWSNLHQRLYHWEYNNAQVKSHNRVLVQYDGTVESSVRKSFLENKDTIEEVLLKKGRTYINYVFEGHQLFLDHLNDEEYIVIGCQREKLEDFRATFEKLKELVKE